MAALRDVSVILLAIEVICVAACSGDHHRRGRVWRALVASQAAADVCPGAPVRDARASLVTGCAASGACVAARLSAWWNTLAGFVKEEN